MAKRTDDEENRPRRAPIPNYLLQAILVTVFCCWPMGLVSIVFAAQVNGKVAAGDRKGARQASERAKFFAWLGVGLQLVLIVLVLVFVVISALLGGGNPNQFPGRRPI